MKATQTIELYKSTQKFLEDLNQSILGQVYEAIHKAEEALEAERGRFYAITEYLRAPFGRKPTGVEAVETILSKAQSESEYVEFREDVFMGASHYRKVLTAEVKVIAKYLSL